MTAAAKRCAVCDKMVDAVDQDEHLRSQHLGPHYFWFDMRRYRTNAPSMTVAELIKLVNAPSGRHVFEDRDGKEIYFCHSEAVDLTRTPHFFTDTPATW